MFGGQANFMLIQHPTNEAHSYAAFFDVITLSWLYMYKLI